MYGRLAGVLRVREPMQPASSLINLAVFFSVDLSRLLSLNGRSYYVPLSAGLRPYDRFPGEELRLTRSKK